MNANLCSEAIWPEIGSQLLFTLDSEAESISAHFLDHLVLNPKRGKYGLYRSPTLLFFPPFFSFLPPSLFFFSFLFLLEAMFTEKLLPGKCEFNSKDWFVLSIFFSKTPGFLSQQRAQTSRLCPGHRERKGGGISASC